MPVKYIISPDGLGSSVVVYSFFMYLTLFEGVLCWSLFCYALLCVLSGFVCLFCFGALHPNLSQQLW